MNFQVFFMTCAHSAVSSAEQNSDFRFVAHILFTFKSPDDVIMFGFKSSTIFDRNTYELSVNNDF